VVVQSKGLLGSSKTNTLFSPNGRTSDKLIMHMKVLGVHAERRLLVVGRRHSNLERRRIIAKSSPVSTPVLDYQGVGYRSLV
jgi:hypothetical protein